MASKVLLYTKVPIKANPNLYFHPVPSKNTNQLDYKKLKIQQQGIPSANRTNYKSMRRRRIPPIMSSISSHSPSSPPSSQMVVEFFDCINNKNLDKLHEFISGDCCYEDSSFPRPFRGRKEVMQFLGKLVTCLGQNLQFRVGHVCEGEDYIAAVKWHLEWKKIEVPYSRGCSFYECCEERERLLIKKAQVIIESPIKPGILALALLRTLSSLADDFPAAAESFLRSHHTILHILLKVYRLLLAPFINPVVACSINLWNIMTLSYQSSLLSRLNHVSSNERATKGPTIGGGGGGLLKVTIGSPLLLEIGHASCRFLLSCFFGAEMAIEPQVAFTLWKFLNPFFTRTSTAAPRI